MSGFGRKGLSPDDMPQSIPSFGAARADNMIRLNGQPIAVGSSAPAAPSAASADDDMSPQLRAFLEQERANRPAAPEPEITEYAAAASPRTSNFQPTGAPRTKLLAYVLWYFASPLAAHRFYLGAKGSAFTMLALFWGGLVLAALTSMRSTLSVGGLFVPPLGIGMVLVWMVWVVVDLFLIPGLVRRYNDALSGGRKAEIFS